LVLKFKKYFNNILGFAGGVMLAVVIFEVIPEIIHLHEELNLPIILGLASILFGILLFHILAFLLPLHEHGHHEHVTHTHEDHKHENHLNLKLGVYGVTVMIIHSFIDGIGIGLAFQVSSAVGIAIAIGVMTHNFSDGINTVSTLLHSAVHNTKMKILFALNILAPFFGVLISKIISVNEFIIFIYLGIFSGSILYLAISDILPQAHSERNNFTPILFTLLGVVSILILTQILPSHSH
jgi:ZIP family zinc transporter